MRRRDIIALLAGAAFVRPLVAHAQKPAKVPKIAIVHPSVPVRRLFTSEGPGGAFIAELRQLGRVEGVNLVIDRYSAEDRADLTELAREAVRGAPDVILTVAMVQVLKEATQTIPIVALIADPVGQGFATSLARPGGNVTGVTEPGPNVWEKRFELLRELVPSLSTVAFPLRQDGWEHPYVLGVRHAANKVGVSLILAPLNWPLLEVEYRRAFAAMRSENFSAIAINDGPSAFAHRQLIVQLVQELRLPAVYPTRQFVDIGGLMTYSVDLASLWRHAARQVDQILNGANPGDIPFYQSTKFDVVINLKTAKALGITIPPTLLARADEVIE
jgi:putative ABC transport system substrate-binding protein